MKYLVLFTKTVGYHVEADSPKEAEDLAIDMDCDKEADIMWANAPITMIEVEEDYD